MASKGSEWLFQAIERLEATGENSMILVNGSAQTGPTKEQIKRAIDTIMMNEIHNTFIQRDDKQPSGESYDEMLANLGAPDRHKMQETWNDV